MSQKSAVMKRHMKRAFEIFFHQGPKAFLKKVKEKNIERKGIEASPIADKAYRDAYSIEKKDFEEELMKYDVISFDVFDTLLARKYSDVAELFSDIPKVAEKKDASISDLKITGEKFRELRIEAEIEAIQEKGSSCNLEDIYVFFKEISGISSEQIEALRDAEIELEKDALLERRDICDVFKYLISKGKTVIITSDMYLQTPFFEEVLSKHNLTGYERLYVSCDEGLRKDDGSLFDKVKNDYEGKSLIHIGDNRKSDFEMPTEKGLKALWIMNSETEEKAAANKNISEISKMKAPSYIKGISRNGGLFNSPFALSKDGRCHFTDAYALGYSAFGPLMYEFMLFLQNETPEDSVFLFLAREGYIFSKLYEIVAGENTRPHKYLLTSRRAVSVATIKNEDDIKEIVRRKYDGSLHNLLVSRLGAGEILLGRVIDRQIHIEDENKNEPDDFEKTIKLIEPLMPDIIEEAGRERKNYLNYLDKTVLKEEREKAVLVDVGYTGTIQYYMSKLLEKPVDAAYLAVLRENEKLSKTGSKVYSMYEKGVDSFADNIEKTQLFLESVLSAPYGQLIRIDSEENPVYRNEELPGDDVKMLQEGMLSYCRDRKTLEALGHENEGKINREYMERLYSELLVDHDYLTEETAALFKVDDSYSQDTSLHLNPSTHRWEI